MLTDRYFARVCCTNSIGGGRLPFTVRRTVQVELKNPAGPSGNVAVVTGRVGASTKTRSVGTWTMVYDEGMEIVVDDGHRFFMNFRYANRTRRYHKGAKYYESYCGETLPGFYRDDFRARFGCVAARKNAPVAPWSSDARRDLPPGYVLGEARFFLGL